ncbi:nucleoside-diphosphate-sugar epimerase [Bradyrhizobium sp. USDA 4473]
MTYQAHIPGVPPSRTVLITGGAGFIGSHLCDALLRRGNRVICVDNLFTGTLDNIKPLLNHPKFDFIQHDVREALSIPGEVDQIYSLACPASPRHYQRDPIGTMKTCVIGTMNVLELARQKTARILQASTSEVYGDPEVHPQPESYVGHVNMIGPRALLRRRETRGGDADVRLPTDLWCRCEGRTHLQHLWTTHARE